MHNSWTGIRSKQGQGQRWPGVGEGRVGGGGRVTSATYRGAGHMGHTGDKRQVNRFSGQAGGILLLGGSHWYFGLILYCI